MERDLYYCFVAEDFAGLPSHDPLFLQAEYARKLNRYLCCDISNGNVRSNSRNNVNFQGCRVLLRATHATINSAASLLTSLGAELIETVGDIDKIHHWDSLSLTRRNIVSVSCYELLSGDTRRQLLLEFAETKYIFIKTREKNFSVKTSIQKLASGDKALYTFLMDRCKDASSDLLISKWFTIKADSLGPIEARCIVIDGRIQNISRTVYSVKHAVPRKLNEEAHTKVALILENTDFPRSFALDLALFCYPDGVVPDIVELNPLSLAMCYVNNSIFDEPIDECKPVYDKTRWGYEFCLDALGHPERYHTDRYSGQTYQYETLDRYEIT